MDSITGSQVSGVASKILNMAGQENTTVSGKFDSTNASQSSNGKVDAEGTVVTEQVAPAVEHETVKKQHETQEQTVVDKERHQDHYHTTVQPLKDQEVKPTKEDQVTADRRYKDLDHRDSGVKDKVNDRADGFDNTREEKQSEVKTQAPTVTGEHVHHHLHETVQPVIEKETIENSVTHKTIPVTERHQEADVDRGVTTNSAISKEEFARKLGGEKEGAVKRAFDGKPEDADSPAVSN